LDVSIRVMGRNEVGSSLRFRLLAGLGKRSLVEAALGSAKLRNGEDVTFWMKREFMGWMKTYRYDRPARGIQK
jgi:hypothetical protein